MVTAAQGTGKKRFIQVAFSFHLKISSAEGNAAVKINSSA